MTQEERQLLLKDLSARLPYGVMAKPNKGVEFLPVRVTAITDNIDVKVTLDGSLVLPLDMIQPYLRPMSSMTEEEENEYMAINCYEGLFPCNEDSLDYILSHHFDFRGLIEKGLALEAPEDMYKEE